MKGVRDYHRLTFSESVFTLAILLGVCAVCVRRIEGWAWLTQRREIFPWGLCSGLDVFCGLALATGGFTVAAALYLAKLEIYRPIRRACMVTAFLGFVAAVLATMANRPVHIAALVALWSPRTRFLGLAAAAILYGALLILEFAPEMRRKTPKNLPSPALRFLTVLLALSAAVLSALQQLSLIKLAVVVPGAFSPLWLAPTLPAQLFLSSICACLAVIVFASWHTSLAFGKGLSPALISGIAKAMSILLPLYVCLRFLDLFDAGAFPLLFQSHLCNYLLGIELSLFLLPMLLLVQNSDRWTQRMLYTCAALVTAGFVIDRLNMSITAREVVVGVFYFPQWIDVAIAFGIVALCVALFSLAVKHLPVLSMPDGITAQNAALYPFGTASSAAIHRKP